MVRESDPPDFEALLKRFEEKARDRAKRIPHDGVFSEYKGTVSFSEIELINPLLLDEAPVAIERLFSGSLIPWDLETAAKKVAEQIYDPTSLYSRSLFTALDNLGTDQSKEVFGLLTDQIREFDPPALVGTTERLPEWQYKMSLLLEGYQLIQQKCIFEQKAFGESETSPETQMFVDALESHFDQTGETIAHLQKSDLPWLIQFDAAATEIDEVPFPQKIKPKKFRSRKSSQKIPNELYELMDEARSDASLMGLDLSYDRIAMNLNRKWDEIQADWTWQEMSDVISLLPSLRSQQTILKTIDAIDDNLESEVAGTVPSQHLSPQGMKAFIYYDTEENIDPFARVMSNEDRATDDMDTEVSFGDLLVPRKLVPMTAVGLLAELALQSDTDAYKDQLSQIQTLVYNRDNDSHAIPNEWMLVVSLLKNVPNDQVRQKVDAFIETGDFPHKPFQEVLLNKKPGSIYLLDNGKIKVAQHGVKSGYCLYTSTYEAPVQAPEPKRNPTPQQEQTVFQQPKPEVVSDKPTKKEARRAARAAQERTEVTTEKKTPQKYQRPRPQIAIFEGESFQEIGRNISSTDLAIVEKAINDYQEFGRHAVMPLRARTSDGFKRYKMRVNAEHSGIRVQMFSNGKNVLIIESINYRGKAYKNL